jgi:hypothetical protein
MKLSILDHNPLLDHGLKIEEIHLNQGNKMYNKTDLYQHKVSNSNYTKRDK